MSIVSKRANVLSFGFLSILIMIGLFSCRNKSEKETLQNSKSDKKESLKRTEIIDTALYLRIGNPDTALVIFMYKNCYHYDYDSQREEYIRWDLENSALNKLYNHLYGKTQDYQSRINQINKNRIQFLKNAKRTLLADYKEYAYISDMIEFEYLAKKKDSLLVEVVKDMNRNKKVSQEEFNRVKAAIKSRQG